MKSLLVALRASLVLMLICGLLYPLATTGLAHVMFPKQAEGSLIEEKGTVIGSELLAQDFQGAQYFHPRASAAKYDPKTSAATQAAVSSPEYVQAVSDQAQALKRENPSLTSIPADLVTASGSGFDPDLSPEAAKAQIPRIAKATGMSENDLMKLVKNHLIPRQLGLFGEPRVNVLDLNREIGNR